MQICDFAYHRPRSVAEACRLAGELGGGVQFLAGGTELLPDFKRGRDEARHLIALQGIPALAEIREDDEFLRIGAMTRLADVVRSPLVRRAFPVLAAAGATIGGSQIRHQGTIGGNFCRAVPCADTPPACIAGGARLRLAGAAGERTLPAEDFFRGPRQTALAPGELLIEILIPAQPPHSATSYHRFARRRGSALAVAAAAARVVVRDGLIEEVRVALGSVAPVPLRARACEALLAGQRLDEALLARGGRRAAEEAQPISDLRGSADYRRRLVAVLAERALVEAAAAAHAA